MPASTPVAILGFSSTDRLALAASLARTARRTPAYTTVLSIEDARYVIADADHPEGMALLAALGRVADAVLIRLPESLPAAPRVTGAIDPALVLRALDGMLARRDRGTVHGPVAPTMPVAQVPIAQIPIAPIPPTAQAAAAAAAGLPADGSAANAASAASAATAANAASAARRTTTIPGVFASKPLAPRPAASLLVSAPARDPSPWHQAHDAARLRREALRQRSDPLRALLVDDSDIALHFLRRHLERYGVQCDFARDAQRALVLLAGPRYDLVFLDLDLGGDNPTSGLALCQQVRNAQRYPTGQAPVVVMVSAFHDPVHQVRGTLAGAEAFLGKPLDPAALERVMQRHGVRA